MSLATSYNSFHSHAILRMYVSVSVVARNPSPVLVLWSMIRISIYFVSLLVSIAKKMGWSIFLCRWLVRTDHPRPNHLLLIVVRRVWRLAKYSSPFSRGLTVAYSASSISSSAWPTKSRKLLLSPRTNRPRRYWSHPPKLNSSIWMDSTIDLSIFDCFYWIRTHTLEYSVLISNSPSR